MHAAYNVAQQHCRADSQVLFVPEGWLIYVAQGRMLAFLLAALVALLGRSTTSLLLRCQQAEQQAAAAQAVSIDTQPQVPASSNDALMSGQGADADATQGSATPQPAAKPGRWCSSAQEAALLTLLLLAANWALAAQGLVSIRHNCAAASAGCAQCSA